MNSSPEEPEVLSSPVPESLSCGMALSVVHRTVFIYGGPVTDSVNTLHLEPRTFPLQKTLSALVKVLPATRLRRFTDLFQNITHHFELAQAHVKLEVESHIRIRNLPLEISAESRAATLPDYRDSSVRERIWPFLQESHLVSKHVDIWKQAVDLTRDRPTIFDQSLTIMHWIHETFLYDVGSTNSSTHLEEAFALRRGVCQDYAHVMIGLCRSVGIAARYASGYLYNGPRGTLVGAQASHAWCEVYLPGSGWIGFDPTNGTLADARYAKVAVGRDYDDVAPIKGNYRGSSHCQLHVSVEVTKID